MNKSPVTDHSILCLDAHWHSMKRYDTIISLPSNHYNSPQVTNQNNNNKKQFISIKEKVSGSQVDTSEKMKVSLREEQRTKNDVVFSM